MADVEPPAKTGKSHENGAGVPERAETPAPEITAQPQAAAAAPPEPGPVAAPTAGPQRPGPPLWPFSAPTPRAPQFVKAPTIDWQAHRVTWQARLGNGLSHLGKGLAQLGKGLVHLGRWLARWLTRLSEFRPTPLQTLAILGGLAALSVVAAIAFSGSPIGQACVIAFAPGLCIAIGILGNRWYSKHAPDQPLTRATQNAIHSALHLKRSVRYIDERLSEAQEHFQNGRTDSGLMEVVRAKTATELSLGATEQASRQWKSASAPDGTQERLIEGSVARVEDEYSLIVNRGSEHGVAPDMVFAVLADGGDEIIDPETGAVIGELPTEKLRVRVLEVHPKYARAGTAGLGAFDSIDESISKMLESELADSLLAREKIVNAKSVRQEPAQHKVSIGIGDRIRQVR